MVIILLRPESWAEAHKILVCPHRHSCSRTYRERLLKQIIKSPRKYTGILVSKVSEVLTSGNQSRHKKTKDLLRAGKIE